jgi:acetate kinase
MRDPRRGLARHDALCFTGGVGEHSAELRERACAALAFLGAELDPRLNGEADREP